MLDSGMKQVAIAERIGYERQTLTSILKKPTGQCSGSARALDAWLDKNAPEKPGKAAQGQTAIQRGCLDTEKNPELINLLACLSSILLNPECSEWLKKFAAVEHAARLRELLGEGTDHD